MTMYLVLIQVSAITVYEMAKAEKLLSMSMESISELWQDEDIFITQLFRRATLLNDSFQTTVKDTLLQHQVWSGSDLSLVCDSEPQSQFENARTPNGAHQFNVDLVYCRCQSSQDSFLGFRDEHVMEERIKCQFKSHTAYIDLFPAPVKTIARMREKVAEYAVKSDTWPYSANILDPVRASIVCDGPNEILEAFAWFESRDISASGLRLCRVKNKFSFKTEDLVGGYRDLMASFVFKGKGNLSIIGEIQFHDRALHYLKRKVTVQFNDCMHQTVKLDFNLCVLVLPVSLPFKFFHPAMTNSCLTDRIFE